ncbi:MAG: stress-induced protein [Betaproteobacteria bacterium]|nr:stress-induced protein [Betaproteobacteria bacterium]
MSKGKQGFASMTPEKRAQIAAMGGKASHACGKAHRFTEAEAREAGKKGGLVVSADKTRMSDIGRKGGTVTGRNRAHMAHIGRKGGLVTANRE